jgi:hypothetical protein
MRGLSFREAMVVGALAFITAVVGLLAALVKFETVAAHVQPPPDPPAVSSSLDPPAEASSDDPPPRTSTRTRNRPVPTTSDSPPTLFYKDATPPYGAPLTDEAGVRVDRGGYSCGGYNVTPECTNTPLEDE